MGCAPSSEATAQEIDKHKEIEKELSQQKKKLTTEIKILLLGAGDTGKSTLIKQIKLIYKSGFTDDERALFRDIIATNLLVWMHTLISAVNHLQISWGTEENKAAAEKLVGQIEDQSLPTSTERLPIVIANAKTLQALWNDTAVQAAYQQAHTFQLGESAKYFFDHLERVAQETYVPSDEDMLLARARTTGVIETSFSHQGACFRVFDVGGQRTERRKWIHCFEKVTSIIFFAALSEYNLALYEERGVNRMKESLKLFDEIANCEWFRDTNIVLFLNKSDLFKEKIVRFPLSDFFPNYTGGANYDAACEFVKTMFLTLNQSPKRNIYPHITCCTDTQQVSRVLNAVRDTLLQSSLDQTFDL